MSAIGSNQAPHQNSYNPENIQNTQKNRTCCCRVFRSVSKGALIGTIAGLAVGLFRPVKLIEIFTQRVGYATADIVIPVCMAVGAATIGILQPLEHLLAGSQKEPNKAKAE